MIVVDASLAAKWLLWEADSAAALAFLDRFGGTLLAPDLIAIEVASALVRRANETSLEPADARELLAQWTRLLLTATVTQQRSTPAQIEKAGRMAIDLGHPLKDCLYLVLAMEIGCELAICDAKFVRKAAAIYPEIKLLRDYVAQ